MDELISKRAAIDALCEEYCNGHHDCKYYPRCENLRWIQELPSAQQEPKWTPCEKALPKENGFYEVTVDAPYKPVRIYEYKPCDWYENKNRWKAEDGCYVFNWFVKAWKEYPKPYERSDNG